MRNLFFASILLIQTSSYAVAQTNSNANPSATKITEVLAIFPTQNKLQLEKSMQAISELGQTGIRDLAGRLGAKDNSDNSLLEYAIGSYSFYVIQPGKEAQRQTAVQAYSAALKEVKDQQAKQFLLYQLQHIGRDEAVSYVQPYLKDETLAGAAARALAQINTQGAEKVLLNALIGSPEAIQSSLIEAMGYSKYKAAVPALIKLAGTSNEKQRKVTLYSLARIAEPSAAPLLQSAAQKAKYTYDNTDATAAFILYIKSLAANGNAVLADKLSRQLLQQAAGNNQVHTRIAALKLQSQINGSKSLPLLQAAMQDKDIEYRAAALGAAAEFQTPATNQQWVKLLGTASPEAQAQIITFLSGADDKSLGSILKKKVEDSHEPVRIAAITALAKTDQQQSLPLLLNHMKRATPDETEAVKKAILVMKGDGVTQMVANSLPAMPSGAKAALLNILAARAAGFSIKTVLTEVNSNDTAVHRAALQALTAIASQKDLPALFPLLNNAQPNDVPVLQQAIVNASAEVQDTAARTKLILKQINSLSKEKQQSYFNVLAGIGGKDAFTALQNFYGSGDEASKEAIIKALSKAEGVAPARMLLPVASGADAKNKNAAINGYLDLVHQSKNLSDDQRLLMLEDIMPFAQTTEQKQRIIQEAGRCETFLSLIFAGKYLDDPELQQAAAETVMNVALSDKNFSGDITKNLLTKAGALLKGSDADYERKAIQKYIAEMPQEGFVALFNGKDLTGWKGLVANPIERAKMSKDTLAKKQAEADKIMRQGWYVKDSLLLFSGKGENLCTVKQYGDFEMYVDWKITKDGDAGIYLRGTPQVQIWDTSRRDVGAQVGSGGLYNNQKARSTPLLLADNAIGEWNTFHIIMRGEKVTVYLNGKLVTDNTTLENYWDRNQPIFPKEQIELQAHGTYVAYRNIFIKELTGSEPFALSDEEKRDGFKVLFDGSNLDQWTGNKIDYTVDNNTILINPKEGSHGNLYTKEEFSDFHFRFEFQLTPDANNGLGIRAPLEGDAAYVGMELQILDNEAPMYKDLQPYQYHGSVYGVIPAKRGFLKPTGEWNYEEVIAKGPKIKVILNGEVIMEGDIDEKSKGGTMDHKEHPGLKRKTGHIGFLGHGSVVRFRNIRIKEL